MCIWEKETKFTCFRVCVEYHLTLRVLDSGHGWCSIGCQQVVGVVVRGRTAPTGAVVVQVVRV